LIARATWRYRLVDITPAFAAEHIIGTLADGLVVLDQAGAIRIVNPAACRLFGRAEADLIGRPVVAASRGVFTADLLDLLARHDVVREYEIALPDAREGIEVLSLTASVLRNETQETVATVCVLRDQTQRKRAEEQLRRSERQLAEAQQLAHLGSWEWDIRSNTLVWSLELYRIFGQTPQKFAGTFEAFLDCVHLEDREAVTQAVKHAQTDREPFSIYYRIVRPDGTERVLHTRGDVVVDDQSRPIRLFGIGQDVTDLKRAEETLRKAEEQLRQSQRLEAMGKFAGEVAHGFNQLLSTMTRNAVHLAGGVGKNERLRGCAEELKHAAEQATMLTRHLLAFSSNQTLKPRVLDLNILVTGLRGIVEWLVKKEIMLVTVLDPGLGWVKVDPAQVELIIMNLAARAQDAMPRGGTLTVKTANVKLDRPLNSFHGVAPPGRYVMLELTDTGDGLDPATLAHLFEPFSATSGINPEIGLRLATVYGIVKQSAGFIVAESEPSRGTSLRVYLPAVPAERAA
jgi:two-component system cell cycle sensor histidine kinase/response regulator CckA